MTKDQLIDFIKFNDNKNKKALAITYLNQLEDFIKELQPLFQDDDYLKSKQAILRKRILDNMNDSIRNSEELFDKLKIIL